MVRRVRVRWLLLQGELAHGFVEKLTILAEVLRSSPQWVHGAAGSQQGAFGPTLELRVVQAAPSGKAAMISSRAGEVKRLCRIQARYGRPEPPKRLIGRGWPEPGAARGVIWRWQKPPEHR